MTTFLIKRIQNVLKSCPVFTTSEIYRRLAKLPEHQAEISAMPYEVFANEVERARKVIRSQELLATKCALTKRIEWAKGLIEQ